MPDLLEGTYKTKATLKEFGFPEKFSQAFLNTADALNSVVMTRITGGATTQLIEERYDLKGFFIKSKSCNWGPMSGFVCQIPLFNKAGSAKMKFNQAKTKDYEDNYFYKKNQANWRKDAQGRILDNSGKVMNGYRSNENGDVFNTANEIVPNVKVRSPFVPLEISAKQKNSILQKLTNYYRQITTDIVAGIAFDKDKTVVMEFLLNRTQRNTWAIYHRNIQYCEKSSEDSPFNFYTGYLQANAFTHNGIDLSTFWNKLASSESVTFKSNQNGSSWWPVQGIQNPFPPYNGADSYKNAVTGDYDLFAAWPVIPTNPYIPWTDTVRYSEQNLPPSAPTWPLFIPATGKKFSVRSTVSENIIVECIPSGAVLGQGLEDPDTGNLHNLTSMVAQMLNSFVTLAHGGNKNSPNASFHSDEGGRPNVNEIDFEVAVFLPPGLTPKGKQPILLISDVMEFVALIEMLKDKCYVFLHYGWLIHLLVLCNPQKEMRRLLLWADDNGDSDLTEFFFRRYAENKSLFQSNKIADLEIKLAKLLIPQPEKPSNQPYFRALVDTFVNFTLGTITQEDTENRIAVLTANPFTGEGISLPSTAP